MSTYRFKSVMLVDDNEIDNLINQKMMESASFVEHIFVHTSAKAAIESLVNLSRLPEVQLPELLFLDIDMPMMDGFQFLDEFVKLDERIRKSCKIIMLTSSLNPQDLKRSQDSSYVVDYLNKPLSQQALHNISI